jgi:hypothetical protein
MESPEAGEGKVGESERKRTQEGNGQMKRGKERQFQTKTRRK